MSRTLEADGWRLIATHGSHRQFKHSAKPGHVTVSGHSGDDMPKGTLALSCPRISEHENPADE